jgi:hypothetical protein
VAVPINLSIPAPTFMFQSSKCHPL